MDNFSKNLVLVDDQDMIIGSMKAFNAHQLDKLRLHRAFSVFLFNSKNELLLQKRSHKKLVYPECWTNTCCSHPFLNELSFTNSILDCKRFAVDRLKYELNIDIKEQDLMFYGRMIYKATDKIVSGEFINNQDIIESVVDYQILESKEDEINFDATKLSESFGEYEIDYLLFINKDVKHNINENEVSEIKYVKEDEFKKIIQNDKISPWIKIISEKLNIFKIFN